MRLFYKILFILLLCFMITGVSFGADYYPTDTWRTSTPEEQGVDSEKLYQILKL